MRTSLLLLVTGAMLAGCVVAPLPYGRVVVAPAPVIVQPQVVYPQYESAYIWDPIAVSFFFVVGGHRHYMDRGWQPRHGYPRGYYRHH